MSDNLMERAFSVLEEPASQDYASVLNGFNFHVGREAILSILAKSSLRTNMEATRDMIDEALGEPEMTPAADVADAIALLLPHLRSGFIGGIRSTSDGIFVDDIFVNKSQPSE